MVRAYLRSVVRLRVVALALALSGCSGALASIRAAASQGDISRAARLYHAHVDSRGYADPEALAVVAVEVLRRCAASDDARVRSATFALLKSLGALARPALEPLARRDGVVGDRAAALLYELDGRDSAPPQRLREALRSADVERRIAGISSLRGRSGLRRLVTLARDDDPRVRAAAVTSLGPLGGPAAEALQVALSDADPRVRMLAPSALMSASTDVAVGALVALLTPEASALSIEAARVLASHGDARGGAHILDALQRATGELRAQAASAAASLPRANEATLAALMTDRDPEVALRISTAMLRREGRRPSAVSALRALASRPEAAVSVRAYVALATTGDERAQRSVAEAMWSSDESVRRLAAGAWPRVVGAESSAVDPLALLLTDADRALAATAAAGVLAIAAR